MFSHQTELHDLKAENERLKDQIHQLQYLVAAAKLEITGKEVMAEQANAKIAELEKSATTLRKLEKLLEQNGTVTISRMWANVGIRVNTKNTTGDAKDLPAAIAAAWERRGE